MKFIQKHFYLLVGCGAIILLIALIPIDIEIDRELDGWKYNNLSQEDVGEPVEITIQGICTYRLFHTPRFKGTVAVTGLGSEAAQGIYIERGLSVYGFSLQAYDGVKRGDFEARTYCNNTLSKLILWMDSSREAGVATVVGAPASSRSEARMLFESFMRKAGLG